MANEPYSKFIIFLFIVFLFGIMFVKYPNEYYNLRALFPTLTDNEHTTHVEHIPHPPLKIEHPYKNETDKQSCYDPRMQSLNSRKKEHIGNKYDEEELASFYIPAKDSVPEDFPVKQIGECPYSKMQAHDIPITDVPQCMAEKDDYNMRIQVYQLTK
jgi:hypothetical protein